MRMSFAHRLPNSSSLVKSRCLAVCQSDCSLIPTPCVLYHYNPYILNPIPGEDDMAPAGSNRGPDWVSVPSARSIRLALSSFRPSFRSLAPSLPLSISLPRSLVPIRRSFFNPFDPPLLFLHPRSLCEAQVVTLRLCILQRSITCRSPAPPASRGE